MTCDYYYAEDFSCPSNGPYYQVQYAMEASEPEDFYTEEDHSRLQDVYLACSIHISEFLDSTLLSIVSPKITVEFVDDEEEDSAEDEPVL